MTQDFGSNRILVPGMEMLGGPEGWQWRGPQQALVERIANSDKDIILLQAEPGIGKTSIAWGLSKVANGNTCILVHTRQLQRQYLRDFDLAMIEGRRHYQCKVTGFDANGAPCSLGVRCEHKGVRRGKIYMEAPDCHYYLAKMKAGQAKVSVHNYAYWLTETDTNGPYSDFTGVDWIVCDEAHDIQSVLMEFDKIRFEQNELYRLGLQRVPLSDDFKELKEWANETFWYALEFHTEAVDKLRALGLPVPYWGEESEGDYISEGIKFDDEIRNNLRQLRRFDEFLTKINDAKAGPLYKEENLRDFWVVDRTTNRREVAFGPLYATRGMSKIRRAANKVLLMSAYLAPKLLIPMLGLDPDECDVIEAPPMYDRRSSLFVTMPAARMSFKTTQHEWGRVTKVIDEIIDRHTGSGIIIVPSKRLRNIIRDNTRHQDKIITYEGQYDLRMGDLTKDQALDQLRRLSKREQKVLIGQSISTGVDLPYVIDFSIIVKLAYPPMEDPVLKERMKRDKLFQPFSVLCELVQAAGRSKRAPDHDCTTYILDGHFIRFWGRYREFFPNWFNKFLVDGKKLLPDMVEDLRKKGIRLL